MPLGNGTKFAGYTIERQLGAGGMGEVYLARHPRLPRHDALKVLRSDISSDPDYIERFNREADLASKLWHAHIVGIHDRGKYRGRLWISMDFVDGIDAGRLLQEHPDGVPEDLVLDIVEAVASALDYAHGMNLLHRDVKPANIMVADVEHGERRVLLADFGVARDLADTASGSLTATNMTVGTAAYAAPEQLMGLDVDGRTDQYSLAATAYHLLTGEQLFQHSNPAVVIGKHLNTEPPRISATRPDLCPFDTALARALAKSPDDRFASCMEFARALEQPADSAAITTATLSPNSVDTMMAPVASPPPTYPIQAHAAESPPEPRKSSRKWIVVAAAAAAVLAVIALVAYVVLQPADDAMTAEPFDITGNVRLSSDLVKTNGLPAGYKCAGAKGFGDVGPNAPIIVEDEAGKLLAKGSIGGSSASTDGCLLKFVVSDVPAGSRFYRVQVGQQQQMSFTEQEARTGVELMMGTTDADTETTVASPPKPSTTRTVTVTPTPDVEQASLARLQAIARDDRPSVAAVLADHWIPQISSKRVGLVAKGITWDNQAILDEHLRLRNIYPDVKLLWSGDWSTYDGPNFWVTVVGLWSDDWRDVIGWCIDQGFDRDNCIAKIVSTTHPIAGSTKLIP
ncbi:protein kinase [Mycobacterium gallinarum]|uniref:non-specific serine/threonine protein kinase n=1 Tax=Mycobacterium gallinarum TaxID=39689 RepID=A0A9W4BD07_9MYCO|nr:serine/threonine-protein kinase [Mycobacterium gallinarum]BBY95615.1 protein kinase [Mycobacterium gallinarum]